MAFVLEKENAIFTSDNVLGHGTTIFEDLATYMASLELMKTQFTGRAYPGHGEVINNGIMKIQELIQHRRDRETQVFTILRCKRAPNGQSGWSAMDIVRDVYKDVPEEVYLAAERGVKQILGKLELDQKAEKIDSHDEQWRERQI